MKKMSGIKEFKAYLIVAILLGFVLSGNAQKSAIYTDKDYTFKQALDLYDKKEFAAAQLAFIQVAESSPDRHTLVSTDADYYSALCAMELFHRDAEYLLKKFIHDHPESPRVRNVYFNLGKYNYRKKNYKDAVEWFNKVEVYDLTEEDKSELYFKRGYSYLERDSTAKATSDFDEIRDKNTKYSVPAMYYYSHIQYNGKNYESALQGFQKLEKDPTFGPVVPYYIAQIYYLQRKYNDVIAYTPALLDSGHTKRLPELARILGESYFKTNRYAEAIPFLERYHKTSSLSRSDSYELGYAYYMTSNCDAAIASFKEAVGVDDTLAQNAWYHMGACYLKKSDRHFAQNAFGEASRLHFNRAIREDALFVFAELTYELSYSPFNQAIKALQQYIAEYPGSARSDEAYSYLVKINVVTRNYEEALKSIESIKKLNEVLKPVYQQIAYNRGVELYNSFDYDQAIRLFAKSMKYPEDPVTSALAKYWTAEASFQKAERKENDGKTDRNEKDNLYETALDNYKLFMVEPGAPRTPMYNALQYNIGYCLFHMKDYSGAVTAFRKYVMQKGEPAEKICNAYMRIGDGYYVDKDFANASEYYDLAFNTKTGKPAEKDYALYQRGMALGLEKKYDTKVSVLTSLLNMYPKSVYSAASKYEVAHTYELINRPDDAIPYYRKLIAENNGSPYVRKSYNQLGLIYSNRNDYDNAMVCYKKVVSTDKNSQEAQDARTQIKQIYIDRKDLEGLAKWDESQGNNVATSAYDSLAYKVAKEYYVNGDCQNASASFGKYIQKYPSGIFMLDAAYMKAECDLKNNNPDGALGGYMYVLSQPPGKYTESSLRRAAAISFNKKDYKTAFDNYTKLESIPQYALDARIGMMRSSWALKDYENATVAANKVLTSDNISPELANEAHLIAARSAMEKHNYDLAYNEYSLAAAGSKNEDGAEAAFQIAFIQNSRKEYKQTEKSIFEMIKKQASYKVWVGKAFLLLSDNYLALNDTFQAKFVLNSFIEHTDLNDLKSIAQDKLNKILDAEKARDAAKAEKELTVPMNNEQDKKLFEEEKKGGQQ
jgi:tetratricopeptide (TPR) repeat protein